MLPIERLLHPMSSLFPSPTMSATLPRNNRDICPLNVSASDSSLSASKGGWISYDRVSDILGGRLKQRYGKFHFGCTQDIIGYATCSKPGMHCQSYVERFGRTHHPNSKINTPRLTIRFQIMSDLVRPQAAHVVIISDGGFPSWTAVAARLFLHEVSLQSPSHCITITPQEA